jgi:hypothetical protein
LVDVFALGSINQDFVLKVELSTHNRGKGANQAAAALLGASVASLRSFEAAHSVQGRAILIPL